MADPRIDHAVVLGASMSGLLAARVLADVAGAVTVVDRDDLAGAGDGHRARTPHDRQPHILLQAGLDVLTSLFPSLPADLRAAGALPLNPGTDFVWHQSGGVLESGRRWPDDMLSMTRPLLEREVRRGVASHPRVEVRGRTRLDGLVFDRDVGGRVLGARVRDRDGTRERLDADLVIDATGRASRTPQWLASHGWRPPAEQVVRSPISYASRLYRRRTDDAARIYLSQPEPPERIGASAFPVEGDRWLVTAVTRFDDDLPRTPAAFLDRLDRQPLRFLSDLARDRDPLSDVTGYAIALSRWRRYDRLGAFPEGLLVVGDAIAAFNPVYGQGMSSSALQARALADCLADGRGPLARRYFRHAARPLANIWAISVGGDFRHPGTSGDKPFGADLVNRYTARLMRRMNTDYEVAAAFAPVLNLVAPAATLLRPKVARRVLLG